MQERLFELIGAKLGWGAQNHLTQQGPQALKDSVMMPQIPWRSMLSSSISYENNLKLNYPERLQQVVGLCEKLASEVQKTIMQKRYPIVIGGDHAIAVGTWSGAVSALAAEQSFGLIWIDAHMDSHTPQTTPSRAIHGMPLAALMGYGESALTHLKGKSPKLDPRHVVLIGVRSFEEGEAALLNDLNVTIYYMEDVKKLGVKTVFEKALQQVSQGTKGFGISVDLDAFDPTMAPGVGTPEPDGLPTQEVLDSLKEISAHPLFCALEIAEFNPSKDSDHKTLILTHNIIESVTI